MIGSVGGGMMGSAAPRREHEDNCSVVMSSPSSPMLLGSVKPGSLLKRSTMHPLAFMRMSESGSSPVHAICFSIGFRGVAV